MRIKVVSSSYYFSLQPHENNAFNPNDGEALNEDEYRYVMSTDYNNIIPQYIENDVNEFMFSNEPQIVTNPVEYYNNGATNSNYAITNLDANAQNYTATSNVSTFDTVIYERFVSEHEHILLCAFFVAVFT